MQLHTLDEDNGDMGRRAELTLYDRYARTVYAYVQLHLSSVEESEDVTVEVFMAALEHQDLKGLADHEQLKWLRRVAKNKVIDLYRRTHRHPSVTLESVVEILYEDEQRSPEYVALRREDYRALYAAVSTLSTLQQQLLQLRFGHGLGFTEIAILLNKREGALRKLLSRTLAFLRTLYASEGKRGTRT